jgi:hydrogenase/urease accessory protein HupE
MTRALLLFALLCAYLVVAAEAHPVAQGSLDVAVESDALRTTFRVSNEQIFVASTFAPGAVPPKSLDEMWKEHAAYLLAHIHLTADAQELKGEFVQLTPPANTTTKGFTLYELRYPFASQAPRQVTIRQDLLSGIDFAPGNPWEATFVARVVKDGRTIEEARLLGPKQPLEIFINWDASAANQPVQRSAGSLARDFFFFGLEHIAAGWDHILFVVALVFAVPRLWQIVALVSAFTLAHTITITLAVLHLVHLPSRIVEPMIALSIVVAAALNFIRTSEAPIKPRLAVAFGFGLFHGLGFASALIEAMASFSSRALATAIAAFSAGVEVGHQSVVIPLLLVMFALRKWAVPSVPWAARIGSAAVMVAGCWMLVLTLR